MIGRIVAPFGIRGEAKVQVETDFPERFLRLKRVCVHAPPADDRIVEVRSGRLHKGQALVHLAGVDRIEDVEALRGAELRIDPADAVELPAGEYYIHDLIGAAVVTEAGRELGALTQVMHGGANDVFVVGEGRAEILLPAIRSVIVDVDAAGRRITVREMPGLIPPAE